MKDYRLLPQSYLNFMVLKYRETKEESILWESLTSLNRKTLLTEFAK